MTDNTKTTYIDVIRHGEPQGGEKIRGQTDDPLTERGWAQMRRAVEGERSWRVIVTSPLTRCRAFAEELSDLLSIPLEAEEGFRELAFGEWEGCSRASLVAQDSALLQRFWHSPLKHRPHGAETLDAFVARVDAAWQQLIQRHHGRRILVVAHAGVIRALICIALSAPAEKVFRVSVPFAGITRFRIEDNAAGRMVCLEAHGLSSF